MGATGLYLGARDMAKLGILYMQMGEFDGIRVFSQQWAQDASSQHAGDDIGRRYGYSFWLNGIGYSGLGSYNQLMMVFPGRKTVFAAHSFEERIDIKSIMEDYFRKGG